jgi:hypothetical protein
MADKPAEDSQKRKADVNDSSPDHGKRSKTNEEESDDNAAGTSTLKPVWRYFTKIGDQKSKCNICGIIITKTFYNVHRHLKNKHKDIVPLLNQKKPGTLVSAKLNSKKAKLIKVRMSKKILLSACLGIATDGFSTFNFFDSPHFRKLLDPLTDGLLAAYGKRLKVNSRNVRELVKQTSTQVKETLKSEMKGKLISLKVDGASRLQRTVFGISAQYSKDNRVQYHTLAMKELFGPHPSTSKNLANIIKETLKIYDVSLDQVVSITSDNGANMLLASKILSLDTDVIADEDDEDDDEYELHVREFMNDDHHIESLQVCRCAAHTVQLCACDLINNKDFLKKVLLCRKITRHVRKNSNGFKTMFMEQNLSLPEIDGATRWLSTFKMIFCIKKLKNFLPASIDYVTTVDGKTTKMTLPLDSEFWEFIDAYSTLLKPVEQTIIKFQAENLNYNQFYEQWIKMKISIESLCTRNYNSTTDSYAKKLKKCLLESVKKREKKLLDNAGFLSAMYLDPRFTHTLSAEKKSRAITFLKNVWEKLERHEPQIQLHSDEENVQSTQSDNTNSDSESKLDSASIDSLFENFLNDSNNAITATTSTNERSVCYEIENLFLSPVRSNIDIVEYWESLKRQKPEIYRLFQIIRAIPPTQVTVERAFSALKLVLSDHRNRLTPEILENILLVKLNKYLLTEDFFDELDIFNDYDLNDDDE